MKRFYSCLDSGFVKQVPQAMQHLANGDKAAKVGGKVVFYTAEDFETLGSQDVIRSKVLEKPQVDGIVFFRLNQFCYGDRFNLPFLKFVLAQGYEVHFARENTSFRSVAEAERAFPMLYSFRYLEARDADRRVWRPVWERLAGRPG